MTLILLPQAFSVCKVRDVSTADFTREFVFFSKTDDELSLVCETSFVPADCIAHEPFWRAFKIDGVLNFSMVGVLANISGLLAKAGISLFAVSTYNTDYIFVKENNLDRAVEALSNSPMLQIENTGGHGTPPAIR